MVYDMMHFVCPITIQLQKDKLISCYTLNEHLTRGRHIKHYLTRLLTLISITLQLRDSTDGNLERDKIRSIMHHGDCQRNQVNVFE